ncbi:MAG: hypothetical protein L6Q31_12185 [Fimbriimonadaceae bacterium]|nr:hypothetical protein [Fimbriimonadaceae bacterium]NUM39273.1 hypothetical protein [Armatimonadota bacterium]
MSVAVAVKVHDGLVLAADSATTILTGTRDVYNVYNHANKIFNLYKMRPVGAMSWGLGSIGVSSVSTIAKDLRARLMGEHPTDDRFKVDPHKHSVEDIAVKAKQFLEEKYNAEYGSEQERKDLGMGFFVGGYSTDASLPEQYLIEFGDDGACSDPTPWAKDLDASLASFAMDYAIHRLVKGVGYDMGYVLKDLVADEKDIPYIIELMEDRMNAPLVHPAMPIKDAIDLAEFLVQTEISFTRFLPGASMVGGEVEVAAISKHEGFKWIRRKHYYGFTLNPRPEPTIPQENEKPG